MARLERITGPDVVFYPLIGDAAHQENFPQSEQKCTGKMVLAPQPKRSSNHGWFAGEPLGRMIASACVGGNRDAAVCREVPRRR